jgi:hypothetical protein
MPNIIRRTVEDYARDVKSVLNGHNGNRFFKFVNVGVGARSRRFCGSYKTTRRKILNQPPMSQNTEYTTELRGVHVIARRHRLSPSFNSELILSFFILIFEIQHFLSFCNITMNQLRDSAGYPCPQISSVLWFSPGFCVSCQR